MTKTILIATDFSSIAENAMHYGADMAKAIGADIYLLHVYNVPATFSEAPLLMDLEDMMGEDEKNIQRLKAKLAGTELNVRTEVRTGLFYTELEAACQQVQPYAVIIGSQGSTAAERLFFGNHAIQAMQKLEWPLIAVPPHAKYSPIKKIGLAVDFKDMEKNLPAEKIKQMVTAFGAQLHILHTDKEEQFDPDTVHETGVVHDMIKELHPVYHFITSKDIDKAIIDFSDEHGIDLLVVVPHRHTLLEKILNKSHTKQLVLHSHVPVMALH